ncbi:MAG TPA: acetyl-CoA C-acetyltransferase [Clostridiaceae bacterium]|nr:acetyl-CoA C-acetyltransferase [Clostridiaceae bacterium]
MKKIAILGACRTAIGKFGGTLTSVPAYELGKVVIEESIRRAGIQKDMVDEVIMGCVIQGGLGMNIARQATLEAGLPIEVPAMTLNNVCGSSLKAINTAAAMIQTGQAEVIVAGGTENMSASGFALSKARFGYRMNDGVLTDMMMSDALVDFFGNYPMGITAENVSEDYNITREMQDEWAAQSQQRAEKAQSVDRFQDEIVPVTVKTRKEEIVFNKDEFPRHGTTVETLGKLRPAFKKGGTVTAGNSSGINDGASAVVLMSLEKAEELGLKPMATIVAGASAGVEPRVMGIGPSFATRKALEIAKMDLDQIELIEANEAFASQTVAVGNMLGFDKEIVNVNGGAIALGHPVGASGCRILTTLLYEMEKRDLTYGLATLCVGGGMGVATIVERCK